jgi:cell division protease FtsH
MPKKLKPAVRSWLIIALVAFAFFSMYKMNPNRPNTRDLTQIEFFKAIEAGKIVEPVVRFVDRDDGVTFLTGQIETDELQKDGSPVKEQYRVNLVPGENEGLMNDLFAAQIKVVVKERKSPISPFVMQLLFFFGFLALFYWIFHRKMGGDGGPFGFGKSRAKILNTSEENKKAISFADVAGIDEAKEEVQEIVEFLKEPSAFQKLGGKIPKGVLLVGPPGTGKTLLAKAIAGEAKVPFFAISGSDFEEMFVGVGASRMRDMFAEAKKRSPCIVFIDEIDSIGQKRTGASALTGSHAHEQTLNTMLVEMDGFEPNEGVIVIAATNRPDTLDSALLRPGRFDRQVVVELPTLKGREEILSLHGKKITFAEDADLSRVARGTPGFSGADLANLLNEAALMAVRKKLEAVDMQTLEEARDKVLWGRERKSSGYSQTDRETTAWHEAGHALLQVLLKDSDPLHKVTIIPRGRALGATMSLPEKDVLNRTKKHFLAEMRICCGGRIAEELFTGDISTGACQDIAQATSIARDMICRYGMSEKFGFQAFQEPSQFSSETLSPQFSEATSREIDAEVKRLIDEAYAEAKKLIEENRDKLEVLAKTLVEKETMDGRDVEELIKGAAAVEQPNEVSE